MGFARRERDSSNVKHRMPSQTTGRSGTRRVRAAGWAAWACPGLYGTADRDESIATIHAALDAGITLLDTGDFYGMGHNELLIGDALAGRPAR